MVNTLTLEQLNAAQVLLTAGKTSEFYTLMLGYGYTYAGWAQAVADADTIAKSWSQVTIPFLFWVNDLKGSVILKCV